MSVGRDYLEIVLRLRRLVPEWVEGYAGPGELADSVDGEEEVLSPGELLERVVGFGERVRCAEIEPERRRWLVAQLDAISTALRWLIGERPDYASLFEQCHGVAVGMVPDRQFEHAHGLLDGALPGQGHVGGRYRAWREAQVIPRNRLQECIELLAGEMRARCREQFGMPEVEQVIWELVSDQPWAGNADYLGARKTRIRINADLPISSARLLELVCHEAYPGHHTEHVCKEASLIEPGGREELAVYVYPSPQAVISEGLACCAVEALLGNEADQIAAACLKPAGIAYDHETAACVRRADELLLSVRSNVALMLDRGTTAQQARECARTWLLEEPELVDKIVAGIERHSWRPYTSCYPVGLALCRRYLAADRGRYQDLLHRQLTPDQLALQPVSDPRRGQPTPPRD